MSAVIPAAALVAGAALSLSALVAVAVSLTASGGLARAELALGFPGPTRRAGEAVEIALHNGRYAAAVLVACVAVGWAPGLRPLLDIVLGGLLGLNAGLIGSAFGAYGMQLLRALAIHGAVELVAFALCGGAYLCARRRRLTASELVLVALCAALLVTAAAYLEVYVSLEEVAR